MGLETSATGIWQLNPDWPLETDSADLSLQHIQQLKKAVIQSFPNINSAVAATHTELTYCKNLSSPVQDQLNQISASAAAMSVSLVTQFGNYSAATESDIRDLSSTFNASRISTSSALNVSLLDLSATAASTARIIDRQIQVETSVTVSAGSEGDIWIEV